MNVNDVLIYLNAFAPFEKAEDWDNCGLLVGDKNLKVSKILFSLDVTSNVIDEAIKENAELIVAHHPVIFGGLKSVLSDSLVYKAIKAGISVIAYHTCYDNCTNGVSYTLAKAIGLTGIEQNSEIPCLMFGSRKYETTIAFVNDIKTVLDCVVNYVDSNKPIRKVAACGGSGGEFIEAAVDMGADAYVTGECKYHDYLKALDLGLTLICAGHYETEVIAMTLLAKQMNNRLQGAEVIMYDKKSPIITL